MSSLPLIPRDYQSEWTSHSAEIQVVLRSRMPEAQKKDALEEIIFKAFTGLHSRNISTENATNLIATVLENQAQLAGVNANPILEIAKEFLCAQAPAGPDAEGQEQRIATIMDAHIRSLPQEAPAQRSVIAQQSTEEGRASPAAERTYSPAEQQILARRGAVEPEDLIPTERSRTPSPTPSPTPSRTESPASSRSASPASVEGEERRQGIGAIAAEAAAVAEARTQRLAGAGTTTNDTIRKIATDRLGPTILRRSPEDTAALQRAVQQREAREKARLEAEQGPEGPEDEWK